MKAFGFRVEPYIIGYNSSIRSKIDIINLILGIIVFFNLPKTHTVLIKDLPKQNDDGKINLILYVDRMSRIFISENNKIHTFHFPFFVSENGGYVKAYYNSLEIENWIISIIRSTFNAQNEVQGIEDLLDSFWSASRDVDVSDSQIKLYKGLLTFLLSFEAGYLRFDHDEVHGDVLMHPANHLDFYYSNKATFKIGLDGELGHDCFINILNKNTPCSFLK